MEDDRRLQRFVRLEKTSFPEDVREQSNSSLLVASSAVVKKTLELKRAKHYEKEKMSGAVKQRKMEAKKFEDKLKIAESGDSGKRDELMKKHAKSSAGSPFLSGTPEFTTHQGGQLSYMKSNLEGGSTQIVNIYETRRAIKSPFNTAESELLLPTGARRDERIGALHVAPPKDRMVKPYFLDLSGEKPKLYVGKSAVMRFKDLSKPKE